jgi:L-alanine-DL-glutamate epimerase-like enolase superfamily enzyme
MSTMAATITAITTDLLNIPITVPMRDHPFLGQRTRFITLLVRVRTKDGCDGFGYVIAESAKQMGAVAAIVQDLAARLVGSDALRRGFIFDRMWRLTTELLHEGAANLAMSAIDTALWDIAGKQANMPLAQLLGGFHEEVACYASHGLWRHADLAEIEADAERLVGEGFAAVKLRLVGRSVAEDVERVRVLRRALGPDVAIFTDGLWGMRATQAVQLSRALMPYDVAWIEDPVAEDDLPGLARVRAAEGTPIAAGERLSRLTHLDAMLAAEAVDHVILDLHHLAGVTPWLRAAAIAGLRGLPISAHVAHEVQLPLLASCPTAGWLEYFPFWDVMYRNPPRPVGGKLKLQAGPGLGLELDESAIARLRCQE